MTQENRPRQSIPRKSQKENQKMNNASTFLPDLLRRISSDDHVTIIFLKELWPQIVGEKMAINSRPLSLQKKELLVAVHSEAWKKELTGFEATLVSNINNYWRFPLVKRVQFTVGSSDRS